MSYAYDVVRPEHYTNVRLAASENYRGLTAVVNNKPYLVIDREGTGYVLEGEDGNKLWAENFEHTARNEQDALIAASRVYEPFTSGTKIGDWTIGDLVFNDGNWHVRNGNSDQAVPIEDLVQLLEDENWFKTPFLANFEIHFTPEEKSKISAMKKVAVVLETNLPRHGWHNRCAFEAQQRGLDGTITYPDGETLELTDGKNFFKLMFMGRDYDVKTEAGFQVIPVTVNTDNPDLFWEIWEGSGGGGSRERGVYSKVLPDTPASHFLDTMEVTADRRDYDHWNEEADRVWWEEEGKHPYEPEYNPDDYLSDGSLEEAYESGFDEAYTDQTPETVFVPYEDTEARQAFLDGFNTGRLERGLDPLTHEEYFRMSSLQKGSPYPGHHDEDKSHDKEHIKGAPDKVNEIYHAIRRDNPEYSKEQAAKMAWARYKKMKNAGWTRVAEIPAIPAPGGTPTDVPPPDESIGNIIHAYPDGDIVLQDGTTTFEPMRAYQFLIGQQEFDKAQQVKELIDRSPPQALPDAVIPADEAIAPQESIPPVNPEEAPLDPTGGQPQPATGAPMQPGTEVPPLPRAPRASVNDEIQFFASKEARKDYSYSEQKELIDENLDGRARNYDKLNLKGTQYELEQESSLDFLWQ